MNAEENIKMFNRDDAIIEAHVDEPVAKFEDNDAIGMRTRARYSLQEFTLDELETFLQETDDDDDIQNVDEQEMYIKFKASIEVDNDDDDEDNDADFQIEIEEALQSDLGENWDHEINEGNEAAGRRPETRQNTHLKASVQKQKKGLVMGKKPLRPLLSLDPNAPIAPFPGNDGTCLISGVPQNYQSLSAYNSFQDGFTHDQINQLHCLIHEHVQLLIQIYSLCVLEPSKEHIALQNQELLLEMVHKRDQVLMWRSMPHHNLSPPQQFIYSSLSVDEHSYNNDVSSSHPTAAAGFAPNVTDHILSVLDVTPLNLVGRYIADVATAKKMQRKRCLEGSTDTPFVKEPLFPNCNISHISENTEHVGVHISSTTNTGPYSSYHPHRKTTAAKLVERAKKQPVAPVSKDIVKLAEVFLPLFNPALYPYDPPSACAAKRVLFTESEDELLALGLMIYNTNWKAIQQRFLPSKTENQIYIRKKNCSSANAPENSIKSVRRMKSSPLSAEEIECIRKGLEVFKYDWMSIWNFIVPYRDPNQLPHQWRVANGTQKSYKKDAAKNKERRLSSSIKLRKADAVYQTSSEREDNQVGNHGGETYSGDGCDGDDEAYVHEFFLANSKPAFSNPRIQNQPNPMLPQQDHTHTHHYNAQNYGFLASQMQPLHHLSDNGCNIALEKMHPRASKLSLKPKSKFLPFPRRYRSRRGKHRQLVKLAPDLLPVNLPKSVRVIPNPAFRGYYSCGNGERRVGNNGSFYNTANPERNQAPLNVSLLDYSHLANPHPSDKPLKASRCADGMECHPLMQRSEDVGDGGCVLDSDGREDGAGSGIQHGDGFFEYGEEPDTGIVMEEEELSDSDEEVVDC